MKKILFMVITAFVVLSIASCGGNKGDKNIEAVKLIPVSVGNEYQYIDGEGKIVITPQFSEATIFRNGLALVQSSGENPKWGFIGEDGKYIITANYIRATVFNEDLAWVVSEKGAPTCIDKKGQIKFTLQNAEMVTNFNDGLAAFKEVNATGEEKWGFIDKEGKVKITPQFFDIIQFREGKCPVKNNEGKWGYIDKEGKIIIGFQFDNAAPFYNDMAIVNSDKKLGLIDKNGKYKINPQFTYMYNDGDMFLVKQDGKYGWTDKEGKIIINPQFSEAFPFTNENIASVKSGKSYGFIDKTGKIIINPQFDVALPFNGKLALVVVSKKIGFIDKEGKYVINPQYDGTTDDLVEYFQTGGSKYFYVSTDYVKPVETTEIIENPTNETTYDDNSTNQNRKWESVNFYKDGVTEYIDENIINGNPKSNREFYYYTSKKSNKLIMPVSKMEISGSQTTYYATLNGVSYKFLISGNSFSCIDSKGTYQGYVSSK